MSHRGSAKYLNFGTSDKQQGNKKIAQASNELTFFIAMNIMFGLTISNHCAMTVISFGHFSGKGGRNISFAHISYKMTLTTSDSLDNSFMQQIKLWRQVLHQQSVKPRESLGKRFGDYKSFGLGRKKKLGKTVHC